MEQIQRGDIKEKVVIIKINKSYRGDMSAQELYDITRGCWKRRIESVKDAEYAFAVFFGKVKEVYKIDNWVKAEDLNRETISYNEETDTGRIGFFGTVANEEIRQKYINKSVAKIYKRGEADPIKVINA